jgi:hypothetical protein
VRRRRKNWHADPQARALEAPTRQIAENLAVDGGGRMLSGQGNYGFDAARKEYVVLVEAGIIDPIGGTHWPAPRRCWVRVRRVVLSELGQSRRQIGMVSPGAKVGAVTHWASRHTQISGLKEDYPMNRRGVLTIIITALPLLGMALAALAAPNEVGSHKGNRIHIRLSREMIHSIPIYNDAIGWEIERHKADIFERMKPDLLANFDMQARK